MEENEQMLISYTLRISSASTSSLTLAPIEDEVQTFPVEGKISLPDHPQFFYLLSCSNCNHFVCIKTKKINLKYVDYAESGAVYKIST
ncbi:hypothetical protein P3S67_020752 [Capsicum chacoense]